MESSECPRSAQEHATGFQAARTVGRARRLAAGLLALAVVLAGQLFNPGVAWAEPPVYQIAGEWVAGTPTVTSNGNLVTAEWR